ncbi:hypothetical protein NQZ68_008295 [Dissostichus eleginoides]|nr:hypothetical protein NQZ68_008295 [Dissostichus eleginoides]
MITFIRKLCSKFLLPTVLQTHLKPQDIPYVDKENHLPGYKLNVGFITRVRLNHLLDAGDITAQKVELFHTASLNFFVKAVEYALQRLPLKTEEVKHGAMSGGGKREHLHVGLCDEDHPWPTYVSKTDVIMISNVAQTK